MIRGFSYILLPSRVRGFGLLSRILVPVVLIALLLYTRSNVDTLSQLAQLVLIMVAELSISGFFKGFRTVLSGLRLIALFTFLWSLVFLLNHFMGGIAPSPLEILNSALRIVGFFMGFALFFQLITPREWRIILNKLGLRNQATLFSMTTSLLPVVFHYLSEALITVKLKYRGRGIHRLITPMALITIHSARNCAEAYALYNPGTRGELRFIDKRDIWLFLVLALLVYITLFIT